MSQSSAGNYIHIVFSTKHRQPLIYGSIGSELYKYLGGICDNLDCNSLAVGGYSDHIHILCVLSKNMTLIKLVEELKSHSSKWVKSKNESMKNFYWQNGYGAFSVNPSEVDVVTHYIQNQHIHHQHKSFQEEYLAFLEKYNVQYDERYVWD